eukprot:SAG22_NODE_9079_length_611_cov_0.962891_1_plen_43_part_10
MRIVTNLSDTESWKANEQPPDFIAMDEHDPNCLDICESACVSK